MPEVRRRRVVDEEDPPVTRRRDRAREEAEVDDTETEDVDATQEPVKARTTTKRRRAPAPVEDAEETDDDEDEVEEAPVSKKTTKGRKLPPGIHTGLAGAEAVRKAGGSGIRRLTLGEDPELIKVLEAEPFVAFRQHWINDGQGQGNRPYVCREGDCPLCEVGDNPAKTIQFNVLHLSNTDGPPDNKVLALGVRAYAAFKSAATFKEKPAFDRDYWAITRSGKNQQSQTNFRPVKERDLEEDWDEIFENFDLEDLSEIIAEAQENNFEPDIITVPSRKALLDIAKYMVDEEA